MNETQAHPAPPMAPAPAAAAGSAPPMAAWARRKIRIAWIACVLWAALELVSALLAIHTGGRVAVASPLGLLDVVLTLGLAWGIARRSRACAALNLAYFATVQAWQFHQTGALAGLVYSLVFLWIYGQGLVGTMIVPRAGKA
ncbi:MAG TPA: hypothetical protein VF457_18735 [Burkholderiaceae bacterium]